MRFISLLLFLCIPCLFWGCTTLEDYDLTPTVSVQVQRDAKEPNESGAFTLTLNIVQTASVTVTYSLSGSALVGTDYADPGTSVVIPSGATQATINIVPKDDNLLESTETVILTIASVSTGVKIGVNEATMQVFDKPAPGPVMPDIEYAIQHNDVPLISTIKAKDPNAKSRLTWAISSVPPGCSASIESSSQLEALFVFIPPRMTKAVFPIGLTVSNGSATTAFTATVNVKNYVAYFTDYNFDPMIPANTSVTIIPDIFNEGDHDPLTLYVPTDSAPRHGTVEILSSEKIKYTPATNFVGVDSFTLGVTDQMDSEEHTFVVTVTGAPPATNN